MTRYHVNPESGRPNICRAKIRCDFAVDGQEPPHFETKEEAKVYAENTLTEEHGETSTLTKPRKLTPAQKERAKGAERAQEALKEGFDPDTLLKYANNHDAWAKGYTEELKRASEEKKNNTQTKENAVEEKTESTIERSLVETTAVTIRAGDVLHGEKFTESGKWIDNDAKVAKVSHTTDLDWKTRVTVTYENGNVAEFTGKAPVSVKRDKNIAPDKPASVIRSDLKNVTKNAEKNGIINQRETYTVLNSLNNNNATMGEVLRAKKLSDMLEDSGQYDPSIKIEAATTRIKMRHDLDYKIDSSDAFALLYDEERTDSKLAEKLKKDFPSQAENAAKNRAYRKEINERNGETWV